jgi:hypothetical protein
MAKYVLFQALIRSVLLWKNMNLLVVETVVPGKKHWPAASHWQTLSHNVVLSTPRHQRIRIRVRVVPTVWYYLFCIWIIMFTLIYTGYTLKLNNGGSLMAAEDSYQITVQCRDGTDTTQGSFTLNVRRNETEIGQTQSKTFK